MHYNFYNVFDSQFSHQNVLITFVPFFSCNKNITVKMAAITTEICW